MKARKIVGGDLRCMSVDHQSDIEEGCGTKYRLAAL